MRADRLLRMIWMLSGRTAPTPAAELADYLEVSVRTVMRDVEALSAAGVPVYTQQGRGGGVSLLPHWRPDLLGLDEDEARALATVVSLAGAGALGLDDAVGRALDKVAVSAAGRGSSESSGDVLWFGSRVVIDPEGWLPGVGGRPWLKKALAAVEHGRSVRFRYTAGESGRIREVVIPALGLLCAGSDWYLVGRSEHGTRFFRLDRIDDLETCEADGAESWSASAGSEDGSGKSTGFGRVAVAGAAEPVDVQFDLLAEWHAARERFRSRFHPLPALLEVRPAALGRLRSLVKAEVIEGGGEQTDIAVVDGETPASTGGDRPPLRARVVFADVSHALEALPRLAGDVRVLEPRDLRARMRGLAARLLADYADQDEAE
ncbi:transcriptional regulator [Actinomyces sp. 432]|uniref:helix-turn-helix transcriptional regulator n=1 Tax=unclassified Actinomyces TaxID=2609248 RepID=UPI001373D18E|nr:MULTISPECIES: WYL domain-containing protein [unclassified Actinomyces]MBW3069762.1 WYL domain-containing protein [Actinomyces sp. 594]QHO92058.1 transcriptional regulator [Actinomyces sp. 432]